MSKKLLLADDSITIQKVIQITFAHEDYDLTITGNGDEALQKARQAKPDLVMADVYMPGKNGYELCAAIKHEPLCQGVPVLLLAGSFEPFDEDKARAAGADAWLEKPFESQTLIDKVAELLEAAQAAPQEAPVPVAETVVTESRADEAPAPEISPELVEDPFGTISFDEDLPSPEPPSDEIADDWGALDETQAGAEVSAPAEAIADSVEFGEELEPAVEDFSFAEEPPIEESPAADEEMFVFEDELEEELPPAAGVDLDVFDESDEDVMALDDGDILGSEELEPLVEEPTLSAWSRDDFAMDDVADEVSSFEMEPEVAPVAEETVLSAPETAPPVVEAAPPVVEAAPPVVEAAPPVVEAAPPVVEAAPPVVEEAPAFEPVEVGGFEPAAVETVAPVKTEADVEEQVGGLSETEIEAIVEKVAGKVIERLAGTILERVAWDVVPDLAEALIKEEINKIKEAVA